MGEEGSHRRKSEKQHVVIKNDSSSGGNPDLKTATEEDIAGMVNVKCVSPCSEPGSWVGSGTSQDRLGRIWVVLDQTLPAFAVSDISKLLKLLKTTAHSDSGLRHHVRC